MPVLSYSNTSLNGSANNVVEFIPGRLYFIWTMSAPSSNSEVHYFTIDQEFVYIPFHADFGPSNFAHVYLFIKTLGSLMEANSLRSKKICLYSLPDDKKRANAAFLMACYMMLVEKQTPERACYKIMDLQPPLTPYRDAGQGPPLHFISILDCLSGLKKALDNGIVSFENFDVQDFLFRERVENGDMNWVFPGKFLAFAGPEDELYERHAMIAMARNSPPFRFPQLIEYFQKTKIQIVIRLNNKMYDRRRFLEGGIDHIDLYFPDGTNPPDHILQRFLEIVEGNRGPFAIHCKAGLGRTGTLIACYLMKHYRFTATEVIGFLRIMRPGSVVGPQQLYLSAMESKLWQMGMMEEAQKERNEPANYTISSTSNSNNNYTYNSSSEYRFGPNPIAQTSVLSSIKAGVDASSRQSANEQLQREGNNAAAANHSVTQHAAYNKRAHSALNVYNTPIGSVNSGSSTSFQPGEGPIPIQPNKREVFYANLPESIRNLFSSFSVAQPAPISGTVSSSSAAASASSSTTSTNPNGSSVTTRVSQQQIYTISNSGNGSAGNPNGSNGVPVNYRQRYTLRSTSAKFTSTYATTLPAHPSTSTSNSQASNGSSAVPRSSYSQVVAASNNSAGGVNGNNNELVALGRGIQQQQQSNSKNDKAQI